MLKLALILFISFIPVISYAWNLPSNCSATSQALQFDNTNGWSCAALPPQKSEVFSATTGFNHTIPDGVTIEVVNAAALLASGTIVLPVNPTDGMPMTIVSPKGVTLASITANTGQTLSATSTAVFAANTPYRLKYSAVNSTWYPN